MLLSMKIQIQTALDNDALTHMSRSGLQAISVPHTFYDLDDDTIRRTNRELKARGMYIDTCHTPFGQFNGKHSTCAEDKEVHAATIKMWQHYMRRFTLTGLRVTPMHMSGCMNPSAHQIVRDRLRETVEAVYPLARDYGIQLALENTFNDDPPQFTFSRGKVGEYDMICDEMSMIVDLVETMDKNVVGICFDAGHANLFGHDVMQDYEIAKPYINLFHIHDNRGGRDDHFTPGQADMPWEAFVPALQQSGYSDPLFAEILSDKNPDRARRIWEEDVILENFHVANRTLGIE